MRKLKRKKRPVLSLSKEVKKKYKVLKYKRQRCAFVDENGKQCKRYAVGKSTLCKKHGGDPVVKENLIPVELEDKVMLGKDRYNPAAHPIRFIELSRQGLSEIEIAADFEISVRELKRWAEKYDSFNTAYEVGQAMHEAWWLQQGKSGLENRGFNTPLFKFLTMNKLGYSDKVEQKSMNMNVHGVLVIPDPVSEDEWEKEAINVN